MNALGDVCPILGQEAIILFLTEWRGMREGKYKQTNKDQNLQKKNVGHSTTKQNNYIFFSMMNENSFKRKNSFIGKNPETLLLRPPPYS